jgi:DnaD/phage-associated family protein
MKKSYYAIIPANVRYDKDLSPNAKLLYGEITALCNEKGYCWAGNSYFAELYQKDKSTIARWIKQLEDKGYIKRQVIYKEGSREIANRYMQICDGGIGKNATTPICKNAIDNNTNINNTNNNNNNGQSVIEFYQQNFGVLSPFVMQELMNWSEDTSEELVIEALKRALEVNKPSWKYAKAILIDWNKHNLKTINDVQAYEVQFKQQRQKQKKSIFQQGEESKKRQANRNYLTEDHKKALQNWEEELPY